MVYALTCGLHQQPVQAKQISKNRQSSKYKQRKRKLRKGGDYALNKMDSKDKIPTLADLMENIVARLITLAANDCSYEGTTNELIFNWVHPLFLKAHAEYSKYYNPN